jgi:hypothetical protein
MCLSSGAISKGRMMVEGMHEGAAEQSREMRK